MSKPTYAEIKDQIHHLIELRDVYDGWSIAVLNDGTFWNRWKDDENNWSEQRRYELTQQAIDNYTKEQAA